MTKLETFLKEAKERREPLTREQFHWTQARNFEEHAVETQAKMEKMLEVAIETLTFVANPKPLITERNIFESCVRTLEELERIADE